MQREVEPEARSVNWDHVRMSVLDYKAWMVSYSGYTWCLRLIVGFLDITSLPIPQCRSVLDLGISSDHYKDSWVHKCESPAYVSSPIRLRGSGYACRGQGKRSFAPAWSLCCRLARVEWNRIYHFVSSILSRLDKL